MCEKRGQMAASSQPHEIEVKEINTRLHKIEQDPLVEGAEYKELRDHLTEYRRLLDVLFKEIMDKKVDQGTIEAIDREAEQIKRAVTLRLDGLRGAEALEARKRAASASAGSGAVHRHQSIYARDELSSLRNLQIFQLLSPITSHLNAINLITNALKPKPVSISPDLKRPDERQALVMKSFEKFDEKTYEKEMKKKNEAIITQLPVPFVQSQKTLVTNRDEGIFEQMLKTIKILVEMDYSSNGVDKNHRDKVIKIAENLYNLFVSLPDFHPSVEADRSLYYSECRKFLGHAHEEIGRLMAILKTDLFEKGRIGASDGSDLISMQSLLYKDLHGTYKALEKTIPLMEKWQREIGPSPSSSQATAQHRPR